MLEKGLVSQPSFARVLQTNTQSHEACLHVDISHIWTTLRIHAGSSCPIVSSCLSSSCLSTSGFSSPWAVPTQPWGPSWLCVCQRSLPQVQLSCCLIPQGISLFVISETQVLHKCLVLTEMLLTKATVPICHADTKALHLIVLEMISHKLPVLDLWWLLVQPSVPLLRVAFPSAVVRGELSWRAAAEASIRALLEKNSCFLLSNFVHGSWSLCSFTSKHAMLLYRLFLASGNCYCKDYFSSIPVFETPIRHFIFKPF